MIVLTWVEDKLEAAEFYDLQVKLEQYLGALTKSDLFLLNWRGI